MPRPDLSSTRRKTLVRARVKKCFAVRMEQQRFQAVFRVTVQTRSLILRRDNLELARRRSIKRISRIAGEFPSRKLPEEN